jgi:hypothetical protein
MLDAIDLAAATSATRPSLGDKQVADVDYEELGRIHGLGGLPGTVLPGHARGNIGGRAEEGLRAVEICGQGIDCQEGDDGCRQEQIQSFHGCRLSILHDRHRQFTV